MSAASTPVLSHVAIIGCGLMGQRHAAVLRADPKVEAITACDVDADAARRVAHRARTTRHWQDVIEDPAVAAVVVATPNADKEPIVVAALARGKHVLVEKPMGATLAEARRIAACTATRPAVLKVGFNHRHHPGLARAKELTSNGRLGAALFVRATYGHGAHRDFTDDWRCAVDVPGGGQLLDQGSHLLDLLGWMFGPPVRVKAEIRTGFYSGVDDNVFALLTYERGVTAQIHVSWTQWKNRFSFDIAFAEGSLEVTGLTRGYGVHRVTEYRRADRGAPDAVERVYESDDTLRAAWLEFRAAVECGTPYGGTAADGLAAMETAYRIRAAAATAADR